MNTKSEPRTENLLVFRVLTLCLLCTFCVCVLFRDDAFAQGMSSARDFSRQAGSNQLQQGLTDSCAPDEVQKVVRILAQKNGNPCPTGPYLCKPNDVPKTTVAVNGMFQCNTVGVVGQAGEACGCGEKKSLVSYRFLTGNYILECPKAGEQGIINAVLCVKCQDLPKSEDPGPQPPTKPQPQPKPTTNLYR